MRTVLGFILAIGAMTTLGRAAEPTTAPADSESPYQLRLHLPEEPVPAPWPYPVVIEVRNGGSTPLVFAEPVVSSNIDKLKSLKLPKGPCLVVVAEPRSKRYGGAGGGSVPGAGDRAVTVQSGATGWVRGQVLPWDFQAPVVRLRALLMLDGKQIAASAWTDDVTVDEGQEKGSNAKRRQRDTGRGRGNAPATMPTTRGEAAVQG
jgi:hypothetical protein